MPKKNLSRSNSFNGSRKLKSDKKNYKAKKAEKNVSDDFSSSDDMKEMVESININQQMNTQQNSFRGLNAENINPLLITDMADVDTDKLGIPQQALQNLSSLGHGGFDLGGSSSVQPLGY